MKLAAIARVLGARIENGSADTEITGLAGIETAGPGQLTFVSNPKYAAAARSTKASAIIVSEGFPALPVATLRSKNPYLDFARALELFYQPPSCCPARAHGHLPRRKDRRQLFRSFARHRSRILSDRKQRRPAKRCGRWRRWL